MYYSYCYAVDKSVTRSKNIWYGSSKLCIFIPIYMINEGFRFTVLEKNERAMNVMSKCLFSLYWHKTKLKFQHEKEKNIHSERNFESINSIITRVKSTLIEPLL